MTNQWRNFVRRDASAVPSYGPHAASNDNVNVRFSARPRRAAVLVAALLASAAVAHAGTPQQARVPARRGLVQLEAQQQRKQGDTFYADGDVDIHYEAMRLRADHAQYNSAT